MIDHENVSAFKAANIKSPVVSGSAIGSGGEGASYTLASGKTFVLTAEECELIGLPRWRFCVNTEAAR